MIRNLMHASSKQVSVVGLVVLAVAVAASASTLGNGFVGDDDYLVVNNPQLAADAPWSELFSGHWGASAGGSFENEMNAGYYRPIAVSALRIQRRLFGDDPAGYHAVNVALHALVCVLVFLLACELTALSGAAIAAIVFAVHAVHVEPVAAIHYQTTLLAALFAFAALVANARRPLDRRGVSVRDLALPLLYALALGAKEEGIVLLPLLLLYDVVIRRERLAVVLRPRYLALIAIAVGYLVLRSQIAPSQGFTYFQDETPCERAATMFGVFGLYARLLIFPFPLCPFYEWSILPPAHGLLEPFVLKGLAAAAALVAAIAYAAARVAKRGGAADPGDGRAARVALFGLALIPVSLVPFLQVIPILNVAAERFLYVGCFGYALLLGLAGERLIRSRAALVRVLAAALLGAYILLLGGLSLARGLDWRSDETLNLATVRSFPQSLNAHLALGRSYLSSGRYDDALEHLGMARRISPDLVAAQRLEQEARSRKEAAAAAQGSR
jgi:tetratricopeptide (TPR) repeat protein